MDPETPGLSDLMGLPKANAQTGIISAYFPRGTPVTVFRNAAGGIEVEVGRAWVWQGSQLLRSLEVDCGDLPRRAATLKNRRL